MIEYVDTHSHIYAEEFSEDLREVTERAFKAGVNQVFMPAIDRSHHGKMLAVASAYPQLCLPMMGLHPTSVKEDYREELQAVEQWLQQPEYRFSGIGEIGIDLYWDTSFRTQQTDAFEYQLDLAIRNDLPAVIHTRNSMDLVLDIVEQRRDPRLRGIFHCFGGNLRQAERVIRAGFLLGIGGVVTYRNSGLQQVVAQIPEGSFVLETDAPWLTPVPHRGKRNEPAFIPYIAATIAQIRNASPEEIAGITTNAARQLFRIPQAQ